MTTVEKAVCPVCYALCDVEDRFCRDCGAVTKTGRQAGCESSSAAAPRKPSWHDNPWIVLAVLFFGLGPFGLPLLWQGQAFSRRGKLVVTLALLAVVVLTCWLGYVVTMAALAPLMELQRLK